MLRRPLLPVSLSLSPPGSVLIWQKRGPQALGSVPRVPRVSVSSAGWAMWLVQLGGGREPLSGRPRPVSENQPEPRCGSGRCWKAPSPPRLPGLGVLVLPSGGLGWRTVLECSRLSPAQGSLLLSVGHSLLPGAARPGWRREGEAQARNKGLGEAAVRREVSECPLWPGPDDGCWGWGAHPASISTHGSLEGRWVLATPRRQVGTRLSRTGWNAAGGSSQGPGLCPAQESAHFGKRCGTLVLGDRRF